MSTFRLTGKIIKQMMIIVCFILISAFRIDQYALIKNSVLSQQEMKDDLDHLEFPLYKLHPYLRNQEFADRFKGTYEALYKKTSKAMDKKAFYLAISEALDSFNDLHTRAFYRDDAVKQIPLNVTWVRESLIVTESGSGFNAGDKILKIGTKSIGTIVSQLKKVIPEQNEYYLKDQVARLLPSDIYLSYLGVLNKDKVEITLESIKKKIKRITMRLQDTNNYKEPKFSYEMKQNIAIFYQNDFVFNEDFIATVKKFFKEVKDNKIDKVVIDVKNSTGGNPSVIKEFLSYLNVNKCMWYTDNYGQVAPVVYINHKGKEIYKGKLYVRTSGYSVSGASELAEIVKFNKIGTVIGEPAGDSPKSCVYMGLDSETVKLSNSGIIVRIPSVFVMSPDEKANRTDKTIYPDVRIEYTVKDIINHIDPVINWVIKDKI